MSFFVNQSELENFCIHALTLSGMTQKDAKTMAKVLVQTEMWGIHTHGVKNLYGYIEKAEAAGVSFCHSAPKQTKRRAINIKALHIKKCRIV